MDTNLVLIAFGLTIFAGLSTGIGSLIALFAKHTNTKLLSLGLGFSAGVMIYVSFVDIFPESQNILSEIFGETHGVWIATISFFGGMLITALIDRLIPSVENPHEIHKVEEMSQIPQGYKKKKLLRTGFFVAIAITIHNIPEGLITFIATLNDFQLGITLAIAIAIHNIPEGIAVSIPIYYATKSRKKAFWYSLLSGLAEPFGALLAYLALSFFGNGAIYGTLFAAVAGIMVFISLDELLPAAREYGEAHYAIYGLIAGMLVMASSILLLS